MKLTTRSLMIAFVAVASLVTASCESTEPKKKKRPPLPGEDESDLSWNRPTGPNDISTPFGLPMSR